MLQGMSNELSHLRQLPYVDALQMCATVQKADKHGEPVVCGLLLSIVRLSKGRNVRLQQEPSEV
jgi:hypothetical protein